jgi:diadenosine tetraphosphate (Ap4A) HIT family hydrolase
MASPITDRSSQNEACVLCLEIGGKLLWSNDFARVVLVEDADHPAFCRVILQEHVCEMTDLDERSRMHLMRVVFEVEKALRELLRPDKVNLASLGNQVPHLHWHVIPRFASDPHFPNPVWGAKTGGSAQTLPEDFARRLARNLEKTGS